MIRKTIQKALLAAGYYLRSTRHFGDSYWNDLATLLRKRNVSQPLVFDAGAHHGETLLAARKSLPGAVIHCFEPDPGSLGILRAAASGMKDVTIHPVALGAKPGNAEFHRNIESMTNSLLPTSAESLASDYAELTATQDKIDVPVETLDSVCERDGITHIDVLKTDCQGYDFMVLQGGEKMISSHSIGIITCEVIFDDEYEGQGTYHELLAFLDNRGYRFMGFYNMARSREGACTFCDAIFYLPTIQS